MSDLAQLARHMLAALVMVCGGPVAAMAQGTQRESEAPRARAEPFRVVWSSSADCGTAAHFASELKARAKTVRDAEPEERATTFFVETFREERGIRGLLLVRRRDGEVSTREVPGGSCADVESALVLIASLVMDPLSMGVPLEEPEPRPTARVEPRRDPAEVEAGPHLSLRAEHRLIGQGGVAPGVSWGQAARLMVTRESRGYRPSIALSAHFAGATVSGSHGAAELEWLVGQLSGCPLSAEASSRWDLRACAVFQLGRLRGTGYGTLSPAARSILWPAAGLQMEGRFEVVGPLWLGWEAAMIFPFTRERFYLAAPEDTLHRVPAVSGSFGLGAGLRFF